MGSIVYENIKYLYGIANLSKPVRVKIKIDEQKLELWRFGNPKGFISLEDINSVDVVNEKTDWLVKIEYRFDNKLINACFKADGFLNKQLAYKFANALITERKAEIKENSNNVIKERTPSLQKDKYTDRPKSSFAFKLWKFSLYLTVGGLVLIALLAGIAFIAHKHFEANIEDSYQELKYHLNNNNLTEVSEIIDSFEVYDSLNYKDVAAIKDRLRIDELIKRVNELSESEIEERKKIYQELSELEFGNKEYHDKYEYYEKLQSRELIKKAQSILNDLGFDVGAIDGIYGNKTKQAICAFQKSQGLPVNGSVTESLIKELDLSITKKSDLPEKIKPIQYNIGDVYIIKNDGFMSAIATSKIAIVKYRHCILNDDPIGLMNLMSNEEIIAVEDGTRVEYLGYRTYKNLEWAYIKILDGFYPNQPGYILKSSLNIKADK